MQAANQIIGSLLAVAALVMFLAAVIRAERKAHPVLAEARKALFGESTPWHGHPMKAHPRLFKWEGHPNYPSYAAIYRREQRMVMRRIGKGTIIPILLILLSWLMLHPMG